MKRCLLIISIFLSPPCFAFDDTYVCREIGVTSIGWSELTNAYTADASAEAKNGLKVEIIGLNTEKPQLRGRTVTPLNWIAKTDWATRREENSDNELTFLPNKSAHY